MKKYLQFTCLTLGILSMTAMTCSAATGTVKYFNEQKGFGFIQPELGGQDVFVHADDLQGREALQEGQAVVFEVEGDNKGRVERSVKRV